MIPRLWRLSLQRSTSAYAWIVVAVVVVALTIASGSRFLFGVVLKPVSEEFGWNRAELTGAVTLGMVVVSLCQPLLGVALIPLSFATHLWQIYLLYGVLTSIGFAAASPVLATAIVGRWFRQQRGLAMSLASSGAAFGQLLIVPLAASIMVLASWRTAYWVLAAALLVVALPLSAVLLRDTPGTATTAGSGAPPAAEDGLTLRDTVAHPAFWVLAFGFVVCGWTMAFPNTHFLAYAGDMGMSVMHAANTVSVTAIFSVLGSVLLGLAADRSPRTLVLALTYALRGVAFLLLLLLPASHLLPVYGLVLGVSWTATISLTAAITADRYGAKHLGLIFGSLFTFMNLGFGVGALLDGVFYETSGTYEAALIVNVALGVAAAIAVALAPAFGTEMPRPAALRRSREGSLVPIHAAD